MWRPVVPQSPLCRPLSSLCFPSAVKRELVTVALPSCLGVLCDQGGEGPVKAPCKGQGSVNVRDYRHCADFSASLLPAVCSCSHPTSPSVLLGLQAWAASCGHQQA